MKIHTLPAFMLLTLILCLPLAHADDGMVAEPQEEPAEQPAVRGEVGDILTPLAIGNTWVFESEDEDLQTIDRIEGVVLFDGQPWHLLRTYERDKGQPDAREQSAGLELWLAMIDSAESDAFIEADNDTGELTLSEISGYYRYPATLGDSYKPNPEDPTLTVAVTALNEKVTTPAGEFDCVVYKETITGDEAHTFTSYVAPGVGIVKFVTVDADGTYVSELTSYSLVDQQD